MWVTLDNAFDQNVAINLSQKKIINLIKYNVLIYNEEYKEKYPTTKIVV